jgi:hypothetical protein
MVRSAHACFDMASLALASFRCLRDARGVRRWRQRRAARRVERRHDGRNARRRLAWRRAAAGNIDFGTGPHAAVGSTDGFVVDLKNQAGAPAWEKYFSGTGFALSTDSTLSPIDGVTIPAPQSTAAAALIGKIDSSGKLLWVNGVSRVVRTTSTVSTSTASRSEQMATPKRSAHSMARSISDRAPRRRASARDRIRI